MDYSDRPVDLEFRPRSYWDPDIFVDNPFLNVLGSVRREIIRYAMEQGQIERLSEPLVDTALAPDVRDVWTEIGPLMRSGEYLPGYLPGEVEIARIILHSICGDVTGIRARPTDGGILYRIVDDQDYMFDEPVALSVERSFDPLSLRDLIQLIDTADYHGEHEGLILGFAEVSYETGWDSDELRKFFSVESEFYWELGRHYARELEMWHASKQAEDWDDDSID